MKKNKILPDIKFSDSKPLKVDICSIKLSKKDKEIIKEVSKKVKL